MTPPAATLPSSPSVVVLRATHAELPGALLKVAGLTVVERALRQLGRVKGLRVVVVTDGTVPIPAVLPTNIEVRSVLSMPDREGIAAAIGAVTAAVTAAAGPPAVIGGDVVRLPGELLTAGIRVVDEITRHRAEDAVFADLLRGDLGFIARHVNKKISFRITRHLLCKLPVTPNQVTLGAAVIGIVGCFFIATGSYGATVAGFLAVQGQSVLDGCDGELARVRFQQTALGEWLDTLVDDFLNLCLVGSLGLGLWRAGHGAAAAVPAAAACIMLLVYNAVSYRELIRQGVGGELLKLRWKVARGIDLKSLMTDSKAGAGRLTRGLLALGRRDVFIFSWLVVAVLDVLPIALLWAVVIALSCFVTAIGQLTVRDAAPHP